MIRPIIAAFSLTLVASLTAPLHRTEAEKKGLDIQTRRADRYHGQTLSRTLTITLTDKRGSIRKRVMKGIKKYSERNSKTVNMFAYPENIKETTLFIYDYKDERQDDQWIYIPAARKVRRVSASQSGEYFMGTDFTYEDMKEDLQLDNYRYKWLRTENLHGKALQVIESIPRTEALEKTIGYSRIISWIDEVSLLPIQSIYYDRSGTEWKVFRSEVVQKQGVWTYEQIHMANKKRQHTTLFEFSSIVFNQEMPDRVFNKNAAFSARSRIFGQLTQNKQ